MWMMCVIRTTIVEGVVVVTDLLIVGVGCGYCDGLLTVVDGGFN